MTQNLVPPSSADVFPSVWGTVSLAGRQWPGRARVTCSRGNDWDRPKAPGEHSAEAKLKGSRLASVTIEIEYWTHDQHNEAFELLQIIEPTPGKVKLGAVEISHAVTIFRGVSQVTIDDIAGPLKGDDGLYKITIQATEQRPVTPKNATGTASGGTGADTVCAQLRKSYFAYVQSGQSAANASVLASADERAALLQQSAIAFAAAEDIQAQIKARNCQADGQGPATNPNLTAGERASDP